MRRTQIQLPEPLYEEVKRVARDRDVSLTEVLRQGAEYMVRIYPADKQTRERWQAPPPLDMGRFLAPPDRWRELANER
jgi:hypothetical protein